MQDDGDLQRDHSDHSVTVNDEYTVRQRLVELRSRDELVGISYNSPRCVEMRLSLALTLDVLIYYSGENRLNLT